MFCITICYVGIFGALRNDWGNSTAARNYLNPSYVNYIELCLSGSILAMFAVLLGLIDSYYHEKNLVIFSLVLLFIGWVLYFAGMIIGAQFV